ncbi:MAG: DUF6788 family protein [Terriglobia bacterium]
MAVTIPQLEDQRVQVVQEIAGLGDFRRGSITSITGRCGKANCRCHQPGHPGQGPNFRLTRKVQGKTVSETFSSPAALRKAEREVAEFHKFQALSQTLVEVNEKLCQPADLLIEHFLFHLVSSIPPPPIYENLLQLFQRRPAPMRNLHRVHPKLRP